MRELRLVSVSEDGQHLLVTTGGSDGADSGVVETFRLRIDDRLRVAVRRRPTRPEVTPGRTESAMTPREFQARLRAGQTVEDIARAAGVPVERVARYEPPIVAERAHMVDLARAATLSRRVGEPVPPPLGEVVDARLRLAGVDPEQVSWDAWRHDDRTWTVELEYADDLHPLRAQWTWDPMRHRLEVVDETAHTLSAALPTPEKSRYAAAAAQALATVAPATPIPAASGPATGSPAAVAPADVASVAEPTAENEPPPEEPPGAASPDAASAGAAAPDAASPGAASPERRPPEQPARPPVGPVRSPAARSGRRASVPSWDDIVFGTRRPQP